MCGTGSIYFEFVGILRVAPKEAKAGRPPDHGRGVHKRGKKSREEIRIIRKETGRHAPAGPVGLVVVGGPARGWSLVVHAMPSHPMAPC
jgi:hypothetical protein